MREAGFATYSQLSSTTSLVFDTISRGLTLTTGGSVGRRKTNGVICKCSHGSFRATLLLTHYFQGECWGDGLLTIDLQHNILGLAAKDAIVLEARRIENKLRLRVVGAVGFLKLCKRHIVILNLIKNIQNISLRPSCVSLWGHSPRDLWSPMYCTRSSWLQAVHRESIGMAYTRKYISNKLVNIVSK